MKVFAEKEAEKFLKKQNFEIIEGFFVNSRLGVQRALKKLYETGVVIRSQKNLDNGGYIYVYQIKSKKEIHSLIMNVIRKWTKTVELELEQWQNGKN